MERNDFLENENSYLKEEKELRRDEIINKSKIRDY